MENAMDYPLLMSIPTFVTLWGFAHLGAFLRTILSSLDDGDRQDWSMIIAATLTLLGLIIGFSFSMSIGRYDQRKNLEAEEANAIGTEYLRAELLPQPDAGRVQSLLKIYLEQRVHYYIARDEQELKAIDEETSHTQAQLWAFMPRASAAEPTPPMALVVSGMNDVLNSSAYTTAAWWNRVPIAAWTLMAVIAICCNVLVGYSAHKSGGGAFVILPLVVAISFLLIADIDSPRGGIIHVRPNNLSALSRALHSN